MKVVALISGGKDSCYNMMSCVAEGHQLVALANLRPREKDELDSYMYQTVGHHAIEAYAEAMELPLYRRDITGGSVETTKQYTENVSDEVEDLYLLLEEIKRDVPYDAVSVGAILSDYQRVRVENVCTRLSLTPLCFLWRRDQEALLQEMISCHVEAVIIKTAALGLKPTKHLGLTLAEMQNDLLSLKEKYGINVCGEGGEYETFTVDCPLFKKKIVLDEVERVVVSDDDVAPVAYLNLMRFHLEDKNQENCHLPLESMLRSECLFDELFEDDVTPCAVALPAQKRPLAFLQDDVCGTKPYRFRSSCESLFYTNIIGDRRKDCDVGAVTSCALNTLRELLQEDNLTFDDVVYVCLYVGDMSNFGAINSTYKTVFHSNPPVRICVEVCLPPNVILQLDALANASTDRDVMHVQSLSHWAPANIGPYSQTVRVGDVVYVAGQIGMVPASLALIRGGVLAEARLALRHVSRALQAAAPGTDLRHVVTAVCYVTHKFHVNVAKREWNNAVSDAWEDSGSSPEGQRPHTCFDEYVVVPGLPRGAQVEWQVCAVRGSPSSSTYESVHRTVSGLALSAVLQSRDSEDYPISVLLSVETEAETGVSGRVLLTAIRDAVDELLLRADLPMSRLKTLRTFYKQDKLHPQDLYTAHKELADGPGTLPFCFVPVICFESPKQIVSVIM